MSSLDLTGQTIAQYHLHQMIGKGGFGSIYKATNTVDQSVVAIKTLHRHLLEDADIVERFQREARSLEALRHPNIVQLVDFGWEQSVGDFMVLEWLPGRSLKEHIKEHKRLSYYDVFGLLEQLLAGLGDAHAQGIVHRDLKPANLFLVPQGGDLPRLKILDFGLALLSFEAMRRTQKGAVMGSSNYMAPEQAMGKITEIDIRTDLYACGCLLAKCLTGRTPFRGNAYEVAMFHYKKEPIPTLNQLHPEGHYPEAMEQVYLRAVARDKEERFSSCWDFYQELQDAITPYLQAPHHEANLLQTFVASDPQALMAQLGHVSNNPRDLGFAPTPDEPLPQVGGHDSEALEFDLGSAGDSHSSVSSHASDVMSFSVNHSHSESRHSYHDRAKSGHSQSDHSGSERSYSGYDDPAQDSGNSFAPDAFAETSMFPDEVGVSLLEQYTAANQPRDGVSTEPRNTNGAGGVPFAAVASANTILAPNESGKARKAGIQFDNPPISSRREPQSGARLSAGISTRPAAHKATPINIEADDSTSSISKSGSSSAQSGASSHSGISLMRRKPGTAPSRPTARPAMPLRSPGVKMRGARIEPERKVSPAIIAGGIAVLLGVLVFLVFFLSSRG